MTPPRCVHIEMNENWCLYATERYPRLNLPHWIFSCRLRHSSGVLRPGGGGPRYFQHYKKKNWVFQQQQKKRFTLIMIWIKIPKKKKMYDGWLASFIRSFFKRIVIIDNLWVIKINHRSLSLLPMVSSR